MKKIILASALLISSYAGSAMSHGDFTHVHLGNSGKPVLIGSGNCLHTANTGGTFFAECGGEMAEKAPMAEKTPMAPKIVKKVIVDCTQCNGNVPKPGVEGVN